MEIYTTEEQQAEAIKKWLKENGAAVIIGIVLGLAGLKGWNYWQERTLRQNAIASTEFETLQPMFDKVTVDEMSKQIDAFSSRNSNKVYYNFLNLKLAKRALSVENFDVAIAALNKVVATPANEVIDIIARIRLARVYIHQKQPQKALDLLNSESKAFMYLLSQTRGDAYKALGQTDKARQAYQLAKSDFKGNGVDNNLQMKIDDLALKPVALSSTTTEKANPEDEKPDHDDNHQKGDKTEGVKG